MKQTAVDWFEKNISKYISYHYDKAYEEHDEVTKIFEQAKAMENEQMLNAFEESRLTHPMIGFKHETFEDYYKKTFKTNEK